MYVIDSKSGMLQVPVAVFTSWTQAHINRLMFEKILLGIAILQMARASTCQAQSSGGAGSCKTCGVTIGDSEYCSECNDGANYAPVDGICANAGQAPASTLCPQHSAGKCTQCGSTSFKYKDGCYQPNDGKPGRNLCLVANAGVCTEAAPGYFAPVGAANTEQSVVACGDTTGVTIAANGNHKYKGVAGCAECSAPDAAPGAREDKVARCTKCGGNKYLKDNTCVDNAEACGNGHAAKEDSTNGNKCLACTDTGSGGVANCDTCSYDEQSKKIKCTKCTGNNYLKTTSEGTSCVQKEQCNGAYFPNDSVDGKKQCVSCGDATNKGIADCKKCSLKAASASAGPLITCTECQADKYLKTESGTASCVSAEECKDGFFPTTDTSGKRVCAPCNEADKGGIADCAKCSLKAASARAGPLITCSECTNNNLSPLKDACMAACPAGMYANNKVCTPCHESCASCSNDAEASCTACYPGSVLSRSSGGTGACIKECTGRYAENCGASQCTAVVGGSKYCSKCKAGFAPVDGVCVSTTTRAPTGCTPGDGVCTACTGSYFLQSGGCYSAGAFPGNTLCTTASNGKCQTCANGQTADNQGSCPACPDGCSKCTGSAPSQQCSGCLPGYYKSGSNCVKCDASDNGIVGVPNCVSCAPPAGGSGSVTCYVKTDGTSGGDDNTGGSANRSGLSTGAIAGISVAVIVVVGGLVSFLCWWFLCRGKA